jgi:protein O-mannosyl-transferase
MSKPEQLTVDGRRILPWVIAGFLLVVIAVVYGQTIGFGFLNYDDNFLVYDCPQVRAGLTANGIAWAFTSGPAEAEWYPLSMISHMLDCQIFGLRAWGHHLTNVLLHAATTIGLFLVLRSMTGELWPSAFVATVFAIHPQRVESVAWIAERRDVLSGLFFVLTLAAYLDFVRSGRTVGRYLLLALVFILGLLSKAMLVTVPPLLLLLDYWPLGRFGGAAEIPRCNSALPRQSFWWLAVEKLPLVAIALADCLMTLAAHGRKGPVALPDRLANAVVALVTYLCQLFYPTDLAVFYPFPVGGHPAWKVAGAVAILVGIGVAVVVERQRRPYLLVGWCWFLGMMMPVIGLVQVSDHAMADRYMYLPGIGLYIALAWGAARLCGNSLARRWVLGSTTALAIVVLAGLSVVQASYWRSGETLWKHSIAATHDTSEAQIGLAETLRDEGRLDEAIEYYRQALETLTDPGLLNNFGLTLAERGNFDEAVAVYRQGLEIDPNSAMILGNLGAAQAQRGKFTEAAQSFRRAIECDPKQPDPHVNLARVLFNLGQIDEAIAQCRLALDIDPNHAAAHQGLDLLIDAKRRQSSP